MTAILNIQRVVPTEPQLPRPTYGPNRLSFTPTSAPPEPETVCAKYGPWKLRFAVPRPAPGAFSVMTMTGVGG